MSSAVPVWLPCSTRSRGAGARAGGTAPGAHTTRTNSTRLSTAKRTDAAAMVHYGESTLLLSPAANLLARSLGILF